VLAYHKVKGHMFDPARIQFKPVRIFSQKPTIHYFVWPVSFVTSCQHLYCVNLDTEMK